VHVSECVSIAMASGSQSSRQYTPLFSTDDSDILAIEDQLEKDLKALKSKRTGHSLVPREAHYRHDGSGKRKPASSRSTSSTRKRTRKSLAGSKAISVYIQLIPVWIFFSPLHH